MKLFLCLGIISFNLFAYNIYTIHGNSLNSDSFEDLSIEGYSISHIQLPGHGGEEELKNLSVPKLVEHVEERLEGIEDLVLIGHSLGGHIAHHLTQKLDIKAIITFGAPPLSTSTIVRAFKPNPAFGLFYKPLLNGKEMKLMAQAMSKNLDVQNSLIDQLKTSSGQFRGQIGLSIQRGEFIDEIEALQSFEGRLLLIHGADDSLVNGDYIKELDLNFIEIPGGHALAQDNPQELSEIISKFLLK